MIDRKFLFFKTRQGFENKRKEIQNESIVFIEGETPADRAIWTHGVFFLPSTGLEHSKGFFESYLALYNVYPWPSEGDWAIVAENASEWVLGNLLPATLCEYIEGDWCIYTCNQVGKWTKTQRTYNKEGIDLSLYLKRDEINLNEYAKKTEVLQYLLKTEASNTYATKTELLRIAQNNPIDISLLLEDVEDIKNAIININEELGNQENTYIIFLTEDQYNALTEYEENAIYFIMKSEWKFGEKFPVILT